VKLFELPEMLTVNEKDSVLLVLPYDGGLKISYTLEFAEPALRQHVCFEVTRETFIKDIAPARTFCLKEHVDEMRAAGCGKGANCENTLVIDGGQVVDNELRFKNEFARHKVLDLIGDLYLLGMPLEAEIIAVKSGHALNRKLVKELRGARKSPAAPKPYYMDVNKIMEVLPHRYPFLLVDRILEFEADRRVVGIKNLTMNEEFFQGHFPGRPMMPGVLQLEAMAQTGGILLMEKLVGRNKLAVLMGFDNVKYRQQVVPGDTLRMEVTTKKIRSSMGIVDAVATVDGRVASQATIKFMIVDY